MAERTGVRGALTVSAGKTWLSILLCALPITGACSQPARTDTARATAVSSPLATSPVWSRPVTILDYFLENMHARLQAQASPFQATRHSDMWSTSHQRGPHIIVLAFLDPKSGHVVLGFDITVSRLLEPVEKVCRSLISDAIAPAAVADLTGSGLKTARNNVLSQLMPRSLYAYTTDSQRSAAYDVLERSTTLRVMLFESATGELTRCDRAALGDTVTFEPSAVTATRAP